MILIKWEVLEAARWSLYVNASVNIFLPFEIECIEAVQEFLQARKMMRCCAGRTENGLTLA
jgi:hypothetical protein